MDELNVDERVFYNRIKDFVLEHGYAPPLDEIRRLTRTTYRQCDTIMRKMGRLGLWEYKGRASAIVLRDLEIKEKDHTCADCVFCMEHQREMRRDDVCEDLEIDE